MKSHKKEILLTTLLCLLPVLAGGILYRRLPETIATHFGFNGEENGWSGRAFAVFGIPLLMAGMNLLLHFLLSADPKRRNMSPPLRAIAVWSIPITTVFVCALTLGHALGYAVHAEIAVPLLTGLLFAAIGNYLPKTRQNYTMGIRLPWTLASEENWNRTHRLAGFIYAAGGVGMILITLLGLWNIWLFAALLAPLVLIPAAYSYLLYRKNI